MKKLCVCLFGVFVWRNPDSHTCAMHVFTFTIFCPEFMHGCTMLYMYSGKCDGVVQKRASWDYSVCSGRGECFILKQNQSKKHFSASALNIQAKAHYIQGNHNQAPLHYAQRLYILVLGKHPISARYHRGKDGALSFKEFEEAVLSMASPVDRRACLSWSSEHLVGVAPHHPLGEILYFFSYMKLKMSQWNRYIWMATWRRRC